MVTEFEFTENAVEQKAGSHQHEKTAHLSSRNGIHTHEKQRDSYNYIINL